MKLSLLQLLIIVCIFISVEVHGRCRKRRITYVQQSLPVPPPPPAPSNLGYYQSFDDDFSGRDVITEVNNAGISSANPQHPNLSCLLFADDGCSVSCGLMCDINGCQSDGFCSQKFYCLCNEVYTVQNRPVTADQFKKLSFDDLWNYKFKSTNNSPNPKNRIFQNDELYGFVMPMLQNPHKSGRDIKEALLSKYPKLSSTRNLQPREHGIKASLFADGGEEKLHQYIQNMMNTIQNSVYDRLSHTRYMRRIINMIKNIDRKEDLSYILRQIRQIGNERLFERVRRYLMKRGYYFDSELRPISKKAGFCVKKKAKCKCHNKCKPKRFSYNYGITNFVNEADSDWVEDEEEVIEVALINELIGSNNAEGKYPSNAVLEEQPIPEIGYTTTPADDYVPSVIQDTIEVQPQSETIVEIIPEDEIIFEGNSLVPSSDTQYVTTPNGLNYSSMTPQQPTIFIEKSKYPEYGTFNSANNNYILKEPSSNFPTEHFINYQTQQIPDSFVTPQTIYSYSDEVVHPSKGFPQPSPQYLDKSTSPAPTFSVNQVNPSEVITIHQPNIASSQNPINYPKPTIIPQNLETTPQPITILPIITSQNLDQSPQTTIIQPQATEALTDSLIVPQKIEKLPQPLENPLKSQDLTPAITTSSQKIENSAQPISIPPTLPKPPPIAPPSQNLLQQFVAEKPTPKIVDSSPYLDKSPNTDNLKTFDIPDTTPSVESLFVKHNQNPGTPGIINNPQSYAEYLLESGTPISQFTQSQSSNVYTPPLPEFQTQSKLFTESPPSISPHQPNLSQPETPASYAYYSDINNNFDSLPIPPPSTNTFSNIQTQSSTMPSPPTMQKPKEKIYYQLLMDENGNIIKSANYKYPGQPQYIQETPQMPSAPIPQYTSTINQVDQLPFDKFDKHTLLNAAKAKPGDSVVIDYDMETAHDIPIFDIPSDIDLGSGTFEVSPDGFGNYILEQDEINNDGLKTLPINYYNNYDSYEAQSNPQMNNGQGSDIILPMSNSQNTLPYGYNNEGAYEVLSSSQMSNGPSSGQIIPIDDSQYMSPTGYNNDHTYEVLSNPQMNYGQGSGIILPSGDLQYSIEIDRSGANGILSNPEIIGFDKELPTVDSPYRYEIDRGNSQIVTHDGLTLDYEGDDAGNHNWSSYSINDGNGPNNMIHDDDVSTIYNTQGAVSNGNRKINQNLNSNDEGVNIEILNGSDDADGTSLGRKSSYSSIKSKSFSSGKGNQIFSNMNLNKNEIPIDIADASNDSGGIVHRYKSGSSSSSVMKTSSQKSITATNNGIPIKTADHNASTDAEDCNFPEDPEDDLMNF